MRIARRAAEASLRRLGVLIAVARGRAAAGVVRGRQSAGVSVSLDELRATQHLARTVLERARALEIGLGGAGAQHPGLIA